DERRCAVQHRPRVAAADRRVRGDGRAPGGLHLGAARRRLGGRRRLRADLPTHQRSWPDVQSVKRLALCAALAATTTVSAKAVSADPTSGVDSALFRSSYDAGGVFSLEGARLMPRGDVSFKLLATYARSPLKLAVP